MSDEVMQSGEVLLYNYGGEKEFVNAVFQDEAFYAFVQNKLHFAVTGKTAADLISERATPDSPTMGLTTRKGAPDGKGSEG